MQPDLDQPGSLARALRELPVAAARPYAFGEFQRRASARERAGRSLARGGLLAVAAVIALAVVELALRLQPQPTEPVPKAARSALLAPASSSPLRAELVDHWLASLPSEPALVHVGTHAAVTGLEDRIAQVDDLLSAARTQPSQPPQLVALQHERTRLIGVLVQVRYAEALADESR